MQKLINQTIVQCVGRAGVALDQGAGGDRTNSGLWCAFEGKCNTKLLSRFVVFKLPLGLIWTRLKTIPKFFLPFGFDCATAGQCACAKLSVYELGMSYCSLLCSNYYRIKNKCIVRKDKSSEAICFKMSV